MLRMRLDPVRPGIDHQGKILLLGSCFTEHIGNKLLDLKFQTNINPFGIIYDPFSIARSLKYIAAGKNYQPSDLSMQNGLWHSWEHHSIFSAKDPGEVLLSINKSIESATGFAATGSWVIITVGSAFYYQLSSTNQQVANCYKAPASWFIKKMAGTNESTAALQEGIEQLRKLNPGIKFILTVSPVRHIKDGIIENNRSKARLVEAIHSLVSANAGVYYFPAFELVNDVLRDYRFFNEDMVHPNEIATKFVFEKFSEVFFDEATAALNGEIATIKNAMKHKPFHPASESHQSFLKKQLEKISGLASSHPGLNLSAESLFFKSQITDEKHAKN